MNTNFQNSVATIPREILGPIEPKKLVIGDGFVVDSYKQEYFNGAMDPLIMVDHYTMTQPTFGPHCHAGLSAVSLLFEDSKGLFHNQDSLGNDFDLEPGDLYWLNASGGAMHDEKPRAGSNIHGLQMFINMPEAQRNNPSNSLLVKATDMPIIKGAGYRARLALGNADKFYGVKSPSTPLTILDLSLTKDGTYSHSLNGAYNLFLLVVSGSATASTDGYQQTLTAGQSIVLKSVPNATSLNLQGVSKAHLVLVEGEPIREKFIQQGPYAMKDKAAIKRAVSACKNGTYGKIHA